MSKAPHSDRILIVEDEEIIRTSLRKLLERHDYSVSDAVSIKAARESFNISDFALIISDLRLPGQPGTDLIKLVDPVPVLIMTSYASLRSAVDTMRQGAVDYISKPFDHDEMLASVRRILKKSGQPGAAVPTLADIALLGSSDAIKKVTRLIAKVALSNLPVLISGETGSGKSAVAAAICNQSKTGQSITGQSEADKFAGGEMISIDCAALKEEEFLSQLRAGQPGATIYLNNIAELELSLQPLLLRELQAETQGKKLNQRRRFICSTDQDLETLCEAKTFRKDLYYQINVVSIAVPPLRQRRDDILAIAEAILNADADHPSLSSDAREALLDYQWPGNLLQLKNMLQQALVLAAPGEPIDAEQLGLGQRQKSPTGEVLTNGALNNTLNSALNRTQSTRAIDPSDDAPAGLSLEDYFTRFVLENQENMSETDLAKKLGISRKSLWERRNKLGISRKKGDELTN